MNRFFWPALALALPAASEQAFVWNDTGGGRMELREHGKPALVYNYGDQLKAGAPEDRRRCCYIFPLYTPAGASVLDDFPPDHWHHRGLFWAWPRIETAGKKYDLWMRMDIRHRAPKPPTVHASETEARLDAENFWQADGQSIVREQVRLSVFPIQGTARELEVELTWQALSGQVTLRGSAERGKSYGGFSARFARREGTLLRADGQVLAKDEDLNPHHWAELEGVYGGKRAVLRITPDASDPFAPYQWCLRAYGFVGASFPGRTEARDGFTISPTNPLTLRFRVRAQDIVVPLN